MPPVEQVRGGLWSIPVPIPGNPLRYVLVYAFELPDGVALVDAGWKYEEAWQALVFRARQGGLPPGRRTGLRPARWTDEGGRGLFLVAQLSTRRGSRYSRHSGKTIWAEQPLAPAASHLASS